MSWKEDALSRVRVLVQEGERIPASRSEYRDFAEGAPFFGWRTKSIAALNDLLGAEHTYTVEFARLTENSYVSEKNQGVAILKSLSDDIEADYLQKFANLISAEVFGDLLEMAQHLFDEGYHSPAASLSGAVLEDGLRRLARNNDITVTDRDNLASLRDKCIGKKLFNNLVRQEIAAWTTLRNSADHGKFNEYTAQQVGLMIAGIRSFLAAHMA